MLRGDLPEGFFARKMKRTTDRANLFLEPLKA
jgi:hypothetical protein